MGRTYPIVDLTFLLWLLFVPSHAAGQSSKGQSNETRSDSPTATLQGVIRDENRQIVIGVPVSLKAQGKREPEFSGVTDSDGAYRFSGIAPGSYSIRVGKVDRRKTVSATVVIEASEIKTLDLILEPDKSGLKLQKPPAGSPDFFDEPHFTVAGVTDTTNLGGHGSDTVVRNREELAQETASLSKREVATSGPDSSRAATERSLRESAVRHPEDFSANSRLGSFLLDDARSQEALPFLENASRLNRSDFDNSYRLARAYTNTGDYAKARVTAQALLAVNNYVEKAELHHLLGDVDEKLGDSLEAVQQYERAAELNTTEPNLFDWGSELLIHHAAEPAIEVFAQGTRLFPRSVRMQAGLGAAYYSVGSYDQAVIHLCQASDLNPADPNPYLFMGKIEAPESGQSQEIVDRLARFVRLQPQNAWANYYYAVSLQKSWRSPEKITLADVEQVRSLLQTSIRLDPKLGLAHLQLGILYSQQKDFPEAISSWQQALEAAPNLEQAHYRLAQVYRETGETSKARDELQKYQQISNEKVEEVERQRHEVQQFVYELRDRPQSHPQ